MTDAAEPLVALPDGRALVQHDRVHRSCYTDEAIFQQELKHIFYKTCIYAGHVSQIREPGDYVAFMIGRQPMLLVRGGQGEINVLYNRCPHRGAMLCNEHKGNTGGLFTCSYHAWQFGLDGRLAAQPSPDGYQDTRLRKGDPAADMKSAARVSSYRGFIFASFSATGPNLDEWLGGGCRAFDDMCDRAPDGEVEIVNSCFRIVQNNNWKIFLENQLDAVHASITHISAAKAATDTELEIKEETGEDAPSFYKYISSLSTPLSRWATLETRAYSYGHCLLSGYIGLRPTDPDTVSYENSHAQKVRGGEGRGNPLSRRASYADLSMSLGAAGVPAIARCTAARARQDADRALALPPQGRTRTHLSTRAGLLQSDQLAVDTGQCRRLDQFLALPGGINGR